MELCSLDQGSVYHPLVTWPSQSRHLAFLSLFSIKLSHLEMGCEIDSSEP